MGSVTPFVRALGIAFAFGFSLIGPSALAADKAFDASRFVQKFPTRSQIPAAKFVVKRPYVGARFVLIHVRNFHLSTNMNDKTLRVYREVQTDVRTVVEYCMDQKKVNHVYAEGLTLESHTQALVKKANNGSLFREVAPKAPVEAPKTEVAAATKPAPAKIDDLTAASPNFAYASMSRAGFANKLRAEMDEVALFRKELADQKAGLSALDQLVAERGLELWPAETAKANEQACQALFGSKGQHGRDREQIILERREDVLLELIVKRNDPIAVTVYGGFHDWGNNIKQWNKEHPDQKFALIEITPEAYHSYVVEGRHPTRVTSAPLAQSN